MLIGRLHSLLELYYVLYQPTKKFAKQVPGRHKFICFLSCWSMYLYLPDNFVHFVKMSVAFSSKNTNSNQLVWNLSLSHHSIKVRTYAQINLYHLHKWVDMSWMRHTKAYWYSGLTAAFNLIVIGICFNHLFYQVFLVLYLVPHTV